MEKLVGSGLKLRLALRNTLLGIVMVLIMTKLIATGFDSQLELRNLSLGIKYKTLEADPMDYIDSDYKLTDGKYGTTYYSDKAWLRNEGPITTAVVFDLEGDKSIETIKANFLEDGAVGIEFPQAVSFYASMDGENWSTIAHIGSEHVPWSKTKARTQQYVWNGREKGVPQNPKAEKVCARYVKVTFKVSPLAFIDEVEIWGYDGKALNAVELAAEEFKYMPAGENTGNIRNLMLLYNSWNDAGSINWTRERIIPYISYVDKAGNPTDWFFDGILYLGLLTPEYRNFGNPETPANKKDCEWYINKTFAEKGDLSELNNAVREVGKKLNETRHKVKVVLMIPNPYETQDDFGDIDGNGISENFRHDVVGKEKAFENRKKTVRWYMDAVLRKWEKANYSNLELSGLYWMSEGVGYNVPHDEDLIRYTSCLVHENKLKFFWIPWFFGKSNFAWKELGFDAAVLQPNHFFYGTKASRIEDAAQLARQYGMGLEIEFDERINTGDGDFKTRYLDYLNGGVDFGYMRDSFKAYYQGNEAVLKAALNQDPDVRSNYDILYQFIKGLYSR